MIEKSSKMEKSYINLSFPLLTNYKCKFCYQGPIAYGFYYKTNRYLSPNDTKRLLKFNQDKKYLHRFGYSFFLCEDPKSFQGIKHLTHIPRYKKYVPTLHKNRDVSDVQRFLLCPCGITNWFFPDEYSKEYSTTFRRHARYRYPKKLEEI